MDAQTIRRKFLEFFAQADHEVVRSSSLIPDGDPTLYFTNAGMVQFKDVFVGAQTRPYRRATSSQKCLRVSGKHNDLENVGRTSRHHTFFEMLGNFSFGDYFKDDAIRLAWVFLTEQMGLDADRLVATVFGGDEAVPADEEAAAMWARHAKLPPDRILRLGKADNFWAMGDRGPCGPCSELHYLQDESLPCPEPECLGPACECDRWIEIWNLVFMQFDRQADGSLQPLGQTGVDTGMGLERLAAVVQGKLSTYDTDLLRALLDFTAELVGKRYGDDPANDVSIRVVADHARATAFCIADGLFPEKAGREYVLRRIMRRAIRHGKLLGCEELFFDKVCVQVAEQMGEAFPELRERQAVIEKTVQLEEAAFRRTLDRGLQKVSEEVAATDQAGGKRLSEDFVGMLYGTYGFPIDLTRLIAEESGLAVDEAAAREWVVKTYGGADSKVGDEAEAAAHKQVLELQGPTDFVGYHDQRASSEVVALLRVGDDGQRALVDSVSAGDKVEVVTRATPLYGRSGGQVGDTGTIRAGEVEIAIQDTIKVGGALIVHQGTVGAGGLEVGQQVELEVAGERRQAIRLNHSATHLLHHALRSVLGTHVAQKGSEVAPGRLRFDFSHFEALTTEEVEQVEQRVNQQIRANEPSSTEVLPFDEARKLGAMALFGEKYAEQVRVVRIGSESVELCGGTHAVRAGDIGLLRIVAEEPLALGVRRIVAVTGEGALQRDQQRDRLLAAAARQLRVGPEQVSERVDRLLGQLKAHEREIAQLKKRLATGGGTDLMSQVQEVAGVKLLATRVDAADPKTLREAGDALRDKLQSGVVVLGGEHQGKATLLVMVSKDLTNKVHAGKLVGKLAVLVGGRGGGRPDMAQAGGPRLEALDQALEAARSEIERLTQA